MLNPKPKLSIVTTLYRSAPYVRDFCRRAAAAARGVVDDDFEVIMVDDGSPDHALAEAIQMRSEFPNLRVLELSRNFGHHSAILAGLEAANGELVFFVDSDLEEAPELLLKFHPLLLNNDVDVVFGHHDRAGQSPLRRLTGAAFWWLIRQLTDVNIHPNLANVRLMTKQYVRALVSMPDRNVFLGGMFAWPGFRQLAVPIKRTERNGRSSYSWVARLKLAALAAVAFSDRPLFIVFWLGILITAVSFLIGATFIFAKLLNPGLIVDGYTSLIVSLWFIGGTMIGSIGTVGFYIAHVYHQTRNRARYIIRKEHGGLN